MDKEIKLLRQNLVFPVALVALQTEIGGMNSFLTYVLFTAYIGLLFFYLIESHLVVYKLLLVLIRYLPLTILIGEPHTGF